MDSLLYLQGNDDDDDDDEEEGEEEIEAGVDAAAAAGSGGAGSSALDFEAVKRAGYTGSNTALSDTATSKRLDEEAKERRAAKEAAAAADAEAEEARAAALAQACRGCVVARVPLVAASPPRRSHRAFPAPRFWPGACHLAYHSVACGRSCPPRCPVPAPIDRPKLHSVPRPSLHAGGADTPRPQAD